MSQIKAFMEEQAKIMERQINHIKKQLNIYPAGALFVRKRKSGDYLYHRYKNEQEQQKEKVLNKKHRKRALRIQHCVIMREYGKQLECSLEEVRQFLKTYHPSDLNEIRDNLPSVYRDPLTYQGFDPADENKDPWGEAYANQFHPENLHHKNSIGQSFRSKGEVQVSELLLNLKIRYSYETRLVLPDGTIYPDFKLTLPGEERPKYIEYCGMLEDDLYLENTMKKLRNYLHGGYRIGRDVLFFFEDSDHGMDVQLMKRELKSFLNLP